MNPLPHQLAQGGVHQTLTFQARLAGERLRHDLHPKVTFATGPGAGVPDVAIGLIDDGKSGGGKGPLQPFLDNLSDAHRFCSAATSDGAGDALPADYIENGTQQYRVQDRSGWCFALRGSLPPDGWKPHSAPMAKRPSEGTPRRETALRSASCASETRPCEWPGCTGEGVHRAPKSRTALNAYRWFCIDHVRAYNGSWNYYAGMTEAEVEADLRRDTVWQRPTWRWGTADGWRKAELAAEAMTGAFGPGDLEDGPVGAPFRRRGGRETPEEMALETLGLKAPVTPQMVKARYKELAKKYHPDVKHTEEGADGPSREEKIRDINRAYKILMDGFAAGTVPR